MSSKAFLDRYAEVKMDVDKVASNVEELQRLQTKVTSSAHRDDASESRMSDLNAENKRLAKRIRGVLRSDQDQLETLRKKQGAKMGEQERSELRMKQTQVNSQSKVRELPVGFLR